MNLAVLGIRGVPAEHGGFETFAEYLGLYLVDRGWDVTVYCQQDGVGDVYEDEWCKIKRINIPVARPGALGTIEFDWKCIDHIIKADSHGMVLTLGYNTALFCARLRLAGIHNLINMDGIEWKRDKWRMHERIWLWVNERFGCWFGDHLIADHPEIANHLATRVDRSKITTIPYGAAEVKDVDVTLLAALGVEAGRFISVIARPEPENSILEIVKAFSRKRRGVKLLMLGRYAPEDNEYHKRVVNAASDEVIFPGAIYNKSIVGAVRYYSRFYVHGHQVGGTNPSLVEALGASSAVLAHDNCFNRWVARDGAHYFDDENSCAHAIERLLSDSAELARLKSASRARFQEVFTWSHVLAQYEGLLCQWFSR